MFLLFLLYSSKPILSQISEKQDLFFSILHKLPDSCLSNTLLDVIQEEYFSVGVDPEYENQFYSFNQPYENLIINIDSLNLHSPIFIDVENKLLIIDNLFEKISIKVYNESFPYLIAYNASIDEHLAYFSRFTSFYQLEANGKLSDISSQVFKGFNFCSQNYPTKTRSYFEGTSFEISCDSKKLLFKFTQTDTIWIMDCLFDILETYSADTLFDIKYIDDVYFARKYLLNSFELIPQGKIDLSIIR